MNERMRLQDCKKILKVNQTKKYLNVEALEVIEEAELQVTSFTRRNILTIYFPWLPGPRIYCESFVKKVKKYDEVEAKLKKLSGELEHKNHQNSKAVGDIKNQLCFERYEMIEELKYKIASKDKAIDNKMSDKGDKAKELKIWNIYIKKELMK